MTCHRAQWTDRGQPRHVPAAGNVRVGETAGLIAATPFADVKAPNKEVSRDRTPDDAELTLILRGADRLTPIFGAFVKLLAYLGQRRDEVAQMRWDELDADLTLWTLPRSRSKNDTIHTVPIAPEVREILSALPRVAACDYLLTTNGRSPISGYSKLKIALDRAITELNGGAPLVDWRIHDLRRGMVSGMARNGVQLAIIEKVVNHTSGVFGGVVGTYQRHEFRAEKCAALEAWARHLRSLVDPAASAKVLMMHHA